MILTSSALRTPSKRSKPKNQFIDLDTCCNPQRPKTPSSKLPTLELAIENPGIPDLPKSTPVFIAHVPKADLPKSIASSQSQVHRPNSLMILLFLLRMCPQQSSQDQLHRPNSLMRPAPEQSLNSSSDPTTPDCLNERRRGRRLEKKMQKVKDS